MIWFRERIRKQSPWCSFVIHGRSRSHARIFVRYGRRVQVGRIGRDDLYSAATLGKGQEFFDMLET